MGLALFAFIGIFILIGSAGLLLFYRAAMVQRLSSAVSPQTGEETLLDRLKLRQPKESIKAFVQPFEKVLPKSPKEVSVIQQRLIRAGFREDSHVQIFYGAKVLVPILLCVLALLTRAYTYSPFFVLTLALAFGFLAPDFWLSRRIKARQLNIRLGLPEALDLMVVCIEAGLSLDQATMRTSEELRIAQPDVCDEFGLVVLEQHAGRPRADAWRNLADRTDVDIMRTLASAIIQADQFGTSIAKTLRVHSETLRVQRRQNVEEAAAKLPVKLVFPLVFFIFPSLFVVALGPAIIVMKESFQRYLGGK